MSYIAIDPGPEKSGFVRFLNGHLLEAAHYDNDQVLAMIHYDKTIIIEWVQYQGNRVGNDVFRTAQFCGEVKDRCRTTGCAYYEMTRSKVGQTLLGYPASKSKVNQFVLQMFPATGGGKKPQIGTEENRGPLFKMDGEGKHAWDALALFEAWKMIQKRYGEE